ncbi:hypothetical protein H6P81_014754 [Aristolochia fimbriata]|uniref:Uncharacterized protein n=1 Tax=Aristolochia fimbriata TaxID=158543 RepID=A0AAV7E4G2_ARIFI|nr:hypothetical protein H6P81_014754 [Aristolochia fimbriata]
MHPMTSKPYSSTERDYQKSKSSFRKPTTSLAVHTAPLPSTDSNGHLQLKQKKIPWSRSFFYKKGEGSASLQAFSRRWRGKSSTIRRGLLVLLGVDPPAEHCPQELEVPAKGGRSGASRRSLVAVEREHTYRPFATFVSQREATTYQWSTLRVKGQLSLVPLGWLTAPLANIDSNGRLKLKQKEIPWSRSFCIDRKEIINGGSYIESLRNFAKDLCPRVKEIGKRRTWDIEIEAQETGDEEQLIILIRDPHLLKICSQEPPRLSAVWRVRDHVVELTQLCRALASRDLGYKNLASVVVGFCHIPAPGSTYTGLSEKLNDLFELFCEPAMGYIWRETRHNNIQRVPSQKEVINITQS